ncbi:hypothetical protein LY632_02145 [Erythrobacter sp. SDW2]|uniref:hypothetical protein n=1 Tax=Erythrobacter sp. SDW2 TaxID=2907154 RepID=UPI001F2EA60D|nr:hypothetical protein [Erythrobacter sp. SDW2]UIP07223.1 hypothetical protein LY632_02145 [Erythrobacter sp. SDW2]
MLAILLSTAAASVPGPVLHYLRTNSDGSEAERVVVYAEGPGSVRVFKGRAPCTNAAYVTARLDPVTGQALELVGGRLSRDLAQQPFAFLSQTGGQLVARLGGPEVAPAFSITVEQPWFLYDFDFSDWIAHPPEAIRAGQSYSANMALILTGGEDGEPSFTNRGGLTLQPVGRGTSDEGDFFHYRATGDALAGSEGEMWFSADDGRLIAARLPLANHSEYRDFAYRLVKREEGEAAWTAVLADHWAGCPDAD